MLNSKYMVEVTPDLKILITDCSTDEKWETTPSHLGDILAVLRDRVELDLHLFGEIKEKENRDIWISMIAKY
jgi:hypothetical protein